MEIERKFLIEAVPSSLTRMKTERIMQGYVAIEPGGTEVRVRRIADRYYLTVKSAGSVARDETQIEIRPEQFDALWPHTNGRCVEKDRSTIMWSRHTIEIDVYHGPLTGLMTAEVEFSSHAACEKFQPPGWFQREVTEDDRFKNRQLAVHGRPDTPGD